MEMDLMVDKEEHWRCTPSSTVRYDPDVIPTSHEPDIPHQDVTACQEVKTLTQMCVSSIGDVTFEIRV
jgi:hypothetical protein